MTKQELKEFINSLTISDDKKQVLLAELEKHGSADSAQVQKIFAEIAAQMKNDHPQEVAELEQIHSDMEKEVDSAYNDLQTELTEIDDEADKVRVAVSAQMDTIDTEEARDKLK